MQTAPWLFSITSLVWLLVFLLHSVRFSHTSLSSYELKRRSQTGDSEAQALQEREATLPRLETLRFITETILWILATGLTIASLGWVTGTLVAAALSLLRPAVSRAKAVNSLAMRPITANEERLLSFASNWKWLDAFAEMAQPDAETVAYSRAELAYIVERSAAVLSRDELLRFKAGLAFDEHTVEDVMTPASMLETADINDSLGPLVLDDLHKTGHSRFPVLNKDLNHVAGILYLHDIINLRTAKKTVREAMDPKVHYIHQNQSLEHALNGFLRTHRHLFVVVNDYRETVGVITLEDVIETLLGKKIVDEFDQYEDLRAVAENNPRKNNEPKGKTDI